MIKNAVKGVKKLGKKKGKDGVQILDEESSTTVSASGFVKLSGSAEKPTKSAEELAARYSGKSSLGSVRENLLKTLVSIGKLKQKNKFGGGLQDDKTQYIKTSFTTMNPSAQESSYQNKRNNQEKDEKF